MAAIDTYLQQIRTAVYGRDVRSAIANGIEECYNFVSAYDGLDGIDVNNIVTNDDLEGYLAKTEASSTYATLASLEDYVNYTSAETLFVTKDELTQNYINAATIADTYATKSQLENYLPSTDIIAQYVKKTDAENFVKYDDLDSYVTKTDADSMFIPLTSANDYVFRSDLDAYATNDYVDGAFVRQTDFANLHSFDVIVCGNTAIDIPYGATNQNGTEGSLRPTADTMYKIYMVPHDVSDDIHYDKYITVQTAANAFVWEKFGGSEINVVPGDGESGTAIDLSDYMLTSTAMQTFELKGSFDNYLEKEIADEKYLSKDELETTISAYLNGLDYATHSDLSNFPSKQEIQDQYATKSQLAAYTTSDDLYRDYATKAYVDSLAIASLPTGDNVLMMLEIDDIPGTTQSVVYNAAGDVDRIVHVRNGSNYRVDAFEFGNTTITETRTLTETGQRLVIQTNAETSQTITTFYNA